MESKFCETQKFPKIWLWLLLIIIISNTIYQGLMKFNVDNNINIMILILVPILEFSLVLVLIYTKLNTNIDIHSITIKMFPFHFKVRVFDWDEIEKVEVRKYRPIVEYGGWGLRMSSNGVAYNVSGNMGLQLVLKNNKKILVGTQKAEELSQYLISIGKI